MRLRSLLRRSGLLADAHRALVVRREHRAPVRATPYGFKLATLSPQATSTFEPEETKAVLSLIERADVFVDIGANIGFYSCLARSRGLEVIAVEPSPDNLVSLYRNLSANDFTDVAVLPVALGERPGTVELFGTGTGASLVRGWADTFTRRGTPVPQHTADSVLLSRVRGRRAVVKLDVEGAEHGALLGAAGVLASEPRCLWIIEVDFGLHHPGGRHPAFAEVFALFFDAGYRVSSLPEHREVTAADIARWSEAGVQDFGSHNFVCE